MDPLTGLTAVALAALVAPDQARATVRIYSAVKVSRHEWEAAYHRTEKVIRDEQGREWLLRLIEFE